MKKGFKWMLLVLVLIIPISYCLYDFPTLRAIRSQRFVNNYEVRVYRLHGLEEEATEERLLVEEDGSYSVTYGYVDLRENDLERFLSLWTELRFSNGPSAMCHMPPYGVQFTKNGSVTFETTICWACDNMAIPSQLYMETFGSWVHFDSGAPASRELLGFFDELLPYDRNYGERLEKEMEAVRNSL